MQRKKAALNNEEVAKAFRALFRWNIEETHPFKDLLQEAEETNTTPLEEVTIDTIKMLRANGQGSEANDLLQAYYHNKREATEQLSHEIRRQEEKKNYMIRKRLGLCRWGDCDEGAQQGKVYCPLHQSIDNFYKVLTKAIIRKRGEGVCFNCHNKRTPGAYLCPRCKEQRRDFNKQYRYLHQKICANKQIPAAITDYEGREVTL